MPTQTDSTIITPLLVVDGALAAIAFYQAAFGATVTHEPITDPDGKVVYSEIEIRGNRLAVKDAGGDRDPRDLGEPGVIMTMQVPDVDAVFSQAVAAGATEIFPVTDRPYGYRDGRLTDPYGHVWIIQTAI